MAFQECTEGFFLSDELGRVLSDKFHVGWEDQELYFDLSDEDAGMYILTVTSGNQSVTNCIIKE